MTLPIPTTSTLAQRLAASMLQQQFVAADGTLVRLDPNAPHTLENVLAVVWTLALSEAYSVMRDQMLELMVTTATENGLLPQHGEMWGVPRKPAVAAIGNVLVTAGANDVLPIDTALVSDGSVQWLVTAATAVTAGQTVSVPVRANTTGTVGNLSPGTALTLVSPLGGITTVVVDSQGLAGGAPIEGAETWRARIVAAIRAPIGGGTEADYARWVTAAGATYYKIVPNWLGGGTVGIVVSMGTATGPVVPTDAQLSGIQSAIDSVRPIRGNAYVVAAQIIPRNLSIKLSPDTATARQQIHDQLTSYYPSRGIGGLIHPEEIDGIISAINGTGNTLLQPSTDERLENNQLAVLGNITWQA